jgi:hypothetical protein
MGNHANHPLSEDWTKPVNDVVSMPDHLDPLFNKLGMQLRFHTITGISEQEALIRMVRIAEEFFLDPSKKKTGKEASNV